MQSWHHILIVDDDDRLRSLLGRYLSNNGYTISSAMDATQAQQQLLLFEFDLIILDVMMPGKDGFSFLHDIKDTIATPVLMLSARGYTEDKVRAFDEGAEDYLQKPFEPQELLARVKHIIKRHKNQRMKATIAIFGPFEFNTQTGVLLKNDTPVKLTGTDIALLKGLVEHNDKPLKKLPNYHEASERLMDVHINRLRRKIEDDPHSPIYLQTMRGQGYTLAIDSVYEK